MKKGLKILLIILLFCLVLLAARFFPQSLTNSFHRIFSPLEKYFWDKGETTGNFFQNLFQAKKISQENDFLKQQNIFLLQKIDEFREIVKENENLKAALGLKNKENFDIVLGQILSKQATEDVILIDKGQADGLTKDMSVITSSGILVGKIKSVLSNFSEVALITAKNSAFDIKVQISDSDEVVALAKGQGGMKLALDFAPKEKEIKIGNPIFTVALGGNFPKGLLVGEIASVQKNDAELFQTGTIKPYFSNFLSGGIFVIKNFR
ncbi:MAG: rod shape-determining protein MreC [Candidatus Pacebacteria bacterium]|nr:rod shape-determining protein MreC [Candidatus Paceibacterota bacterium]